MRRHRFSNRERDREREELRREKREGKNYQSVLDVSRKYEKRIKGEISKKNLIFLAILEKSIKVFHGSSNQVFFMKPLLINDKNILLVYRIFIIFSTSFSFQN